MPVKRTVLLKAQEDILLPKSPGLWLHALFFKWLEKSHPELGKELHGAAPAPFSLSTLIGLKRKQKKLVLKGEEYVSFEVAGLAPQVEEWLLAAGEEEILFNQQKILLIPAGLKQKTFQQLVCQSKEKTFSYVSPATFRHYGRNLPLPVPELVFGSLLRRWHSFAEKGLLPEEDHVADILLKKFELKSRMLDLQKYRLSAFVGSTTFLAASKEAEVLLGSLAGFAVFAGVGYKTTMGFGCVEVHGT